MPTNHAVVADSFALSDDSPVQIETGPVEVLRWQPPSHLGLHRPALILLAGERATMPGVRMGPHTALHVEFGPGLPQISPDGMTLTFSAETNGTIHHLATVTLTNDQAQTPRALTLHLGFVPAEVARLVIEAGPGPLSDPTADWASIISLAVGPADSLNLLKARSFKALRTANEIAHFAVVYDHALYAERNRKARGEDEVAPHAAEPEHPDLPLPGEHVFSYGMRLLAQSLRMPKPPDFAARLRAKASGRPLRMASLCSGTAQVEAGLIRAAKVPIDLTLVDISDMLLEKAKSYMPDGVQTQILVHDVNRVELEPDNYDVIVCVSGIHHAVELERIWQQVRRALRPDGELWLIGEQIGPNGNRLAPADYKVANSVFRSLPEKHRLNAHTGQIDHDLPNVDCSETTFEGIRSQDIEPTLGRFFLPAHVYKRNCFLWMLLNQAYSENYDLKRAEDAALVRSLVRAELEHFTNGGTAAELHAAYTPLS